MSIFDSIVSGIFRHGNSCCDAGSKPCHASAQNNRGSGTNDCRCHTALANRR